MRQPDPRARSASGNAQFSEDVASARQDVDRMADEWPASHRADVLLGTLIARVEALGLALDRIENQLVGRLAVLEAKMAEIEHQQLQRSGRLQILAVIWSGAAIVAAWLWANLAEVLAVVLEHMKLKP